MAAFELLRRYWPLLAISAALALTGLRCYDLGRSAERRIWQADWAQRDLDEATARADAERRARETEQAEARKYEKVQRDATQALEAARTDAASAGAAADRLREQVRLLSARRAPQAPGPAGSGDPGPDTCGMLAVVLDKSVERNRRLAEIADSARVGWQACASLQ